MKEQHFCLTHEMTGLELVYIKHNEVQINRLLYIKFVHCYSLGGRSGLDTVETAGVDMRCGDVPIEIIIHK